MLGRNKKSDKEKMREKAAVQDSMNTGGIEQQQINRKQQQQDNQNNNPLFNVEESRQLIEKGLKGKETKVMQYQDPDTGDIKQQVVEYDTRQRKLCNDDAAELYLEICNSGALNQNTISGYLPARQIQRKVMGTMKPVFEHVLFDHHIHGVGYKNTQDASSISSIVRNPLIDAMNKARGGRMIESQEKVRVEKETTTRDANENQDDDSGLRSLF